MGRNNEPLGEVSMATSVQKVGRDGLEGKGPGLEHVGFKVYTKEDLEKEGYDDEVSRNLNEHANNVIIRTPNCQL